MSFNYSQHKGGGDHGSMWTSYSDLFLGLSIIFLLLYVAASLRQGTDGVQQQQEMQRMAQQVVDLKQQIKVYDTLKQNYLETGASNDEQGTYKELMEKLTLLREDAKKEKDDLRAQATENEKKEAALNKYQQLVRNIINSNLVASMRIKRRDVIIEKKDETIAENEEEIGDLEKTVARNKAKIAQDESKIAATEQQLDKRVKQLRDAYRAQHITKKKFDQQTAALRSEAQSRIEALREEKARTEQALNATSAKLSSTSNELESTETALKAAGQEKDRLVGELKGMEAKSATQLAKVRADIEAKNAAQTAALKGQYEAQRAKDRAAFEDALGKEKLSGAQRAMKEAQFRAEADRKAKEFGDKLSGMNKKLADTEGQLARAQENLNARKKLADQIKHAFAQRGVSAEVDPDSGDVMLSFGNHYFDTGRAELKTEMRDILQKAMPAYSQSLFGDPKIADKIQSVEIVGFASPTYKGKFIDPNALQGGDRKAVNYNLDLSYSRARAIFNYAFDADKMTFDHQKQMLPLIKVTGRSFLAEGRDRNPAARDPACEKGDCAKARRVIIKFTLKD